MEKYGSGNGTKQPGLGKKLKNWCGMDDQLSCQLLAAVNIIELGSSSTLLSCESSIL